MNCSLVICHTDSSRALRSVLKTVARQTERQFETIIVDDSDSPHSADVVREFAALHPRISFQHVQASPATADAESLAVSAWQRGAECATTPYLVFVPRATLLHESFVETHVAWRGTNRVLLGPRGAAVQPLLSQQLVAARVGYRPSWRWVMHHALRGELTDPRHGVVVRAAWLRRWLLGRATSLEVGHASLTRDAWLRVVERCTARGEAIDPLRIGPQLAELGLAPIDLSGLAVTLQLSLATAPPGAPARAERRSRANGSRGVARSE